MGRRHSTTGTTGRAALRREYGKAVLDVPHHAFVALVAGAFGKYDYLPAFQHLEYLAHGGKLGLVTVDHDDAEMREQPVGEFFVPELLLAYIPPVPRHVHLYERYVHRRKVVGRVYARPAFDDVFLTDHLRPVKRSAKREQSFSEIIKLFSHLFFIPLFPARERPRRKASS